MNTIKKGTSRRRKKEETLQQRIEQAKKAKQRTVQTLPPVTVSPTDNITTPYAVVGWIFRALVMFIGVCGLMLFLCDAVGIVVLSHARAENVTLDAGFIVLWSAVVAVFYALCALTRPTRILAPFLVLGGGVGYLLLSYPNPADFVIKTARHLADLVMTNLAEVGYTTYLQYISEGEYRYDAETMLRFAVAALTVFFGSLLCASIVRRVRALPVTLLVVLFFVPVFMFNLTRTNKPLALVLIFLCGVLALYLYDCRYMGVWEAKKEKKRAKKERKAAKKAAKTEKKTAKKQLKQDALLAYTTAVKSGADAKTAVKAKNTVYDKAKREKENAKKAAVLQRENEKIAAKNEKRTAKAARSESKAANRAEVRRLKASLAAIRKTKQSDEAKKAQIAEVKAMLREAKNAPRAEKRTARTRQRKLIAVGGYAGFMAMVVAFLAVWIPTVAVHKNFPIIDPINNRMQLARTYVTAYLMGDDVDLNSLALYGGVAELNPRTVTFDTPQYTGQRIFTVEAGYAAPVYLRSWIGTEYDLETDSWLSADTDQVIDYRARFGSSYTSDHISYFFNKYVYPNAIDIPKFDQYRNLDDYGFRVFQINVRRDSGTSKLLFIPSVMNTGLGLMQFGSIEPVTQKYSAFYDGIYSSRFFGEKSSYSTSSFVPVLKVENLGENFEGSILYYNLAKKYCEAIDQINESIDGNLLFDEGRAYTYETAVGTFTFAGRDLSFLNERFEAELASLTDYKYRVESLVWTYLNMTSGERRVFHNAFNSELNYRDYASEMYTQSFGSEKISSLAADILDSAGIVMHDRPVHDKSFMEGLSDYQLKKLTPVEKYGNQYETWFTDTAGNPVPRHQAVMAVINYLRQNYTYTLTPETAMKPLLDEAGNPVLDEAGEQVMVADLKEASSIESFLFEVKEGYCVHFATAAVGLLRELGFAVRYDEGYIAAGWNRTYNPESVSTYRSVVRDYDAHSWIEVYYPAIGWVQYETTPEYGSEMYDLEELGTSGSSGVNPSKVTVSTPTETEEMPEVSLGSNEETDYLPLFIALAVLAGLILVFCVVWAILRRRAMKAVDKRKKLLGKAKDEAAFHEADFDVHKTARSITDAIFDLFNGMGLPHEKGELPTEYAARLSADYGELSKLPVGEVMRIIEKEEFGGRLTQRELGALAGYLEDVTASVYAGLSLSDKIRMRYFKNII